MKSYNVIKKVLIIFYILLSVLMTAQAQNATDLTTNAQIVNGNVNLRARYPKFSVKTLYTFRLDQGESLGVVNEGTRVRVLRKRIIAARYEWFEIQYLQGSERKQGWIYGGEVGNRLYIKFDKGVEQQIPVSRVNEINQWTPQLGIGYLWLKSAYAEVNTVPDAIQTDPLKTLLLGFCYLVIFISALIVVKKWIFPDSNFLVFLMSLCVLLILGFLSDKLFANLLGNFLPIAK